jgi:hypothetical protein
MNPGIGEIVHYVSYGTPGGEYPSVCRAAVITAVDDFGYHGEANVIDLCVLNPEGMFFNKRVEYSDEHVGGTWHWPEYGD